MLTESLAAKFECDVQWERAAKFLDIDPLLLRQIREPRLECAARIPCVGGTALLHSAAGPLICKDTLATIAVGPEASAEAARVALADLQCDAALADELRSSAAVTLQLPADLHESELWQCARECAPILSRGLGATSFLSDDPPSAAFARWVCSAAVPYHVQFSAGSETHCAGARTAEAMVVCASLALHERAKSIHGAAVAVLGSGATARSAMRAFTEAGSRIIAVADESGAVVETSGLQIPALLAHIEGGGLLTEYAGAEHVRRSDVLALAIDAVLLADDNGINPEAAVRIRAKVVLLAPGANIAVESLEALEAGGMMVIPEALSRSARLLLPTGDADLRRRIEAIWEKLKDLRDRHAPSLDFAVRVLVLQTLAEREQGRRP
jgi:hypothetical protein